MHEKLKRFLCFYCECHCPIEDKAAVDNLKSFEMDDRFEFDPEECSVNTGKWVFNKSLKPFYTDSSCPYLDRQVSCVKNGRRDSDYQRWEWLPDDCTLPRWKTGES